MLQFNRSPLYNWPHEEFNVFDIRQFYFTLKPTEIKLLFLYFCGWNRLVIVFGARSLSYSCIFGSPHCEQVCNPKVWILLVFQIL